MVEKINKARIAGLHLQLGLKVETSFVLSRHRYKCYQQHQKSQDLPQNNIQTILLKFCKGQRRSYPSKILTEPHCEERITIQSISDCGSASASTEDLVHPASSQTRSTVLHVDLKFGYGHVLYQPNSHQLLGYKVSLNLQVSYSYATVVPLDTFTKAAQDRAPVRVRFIM